MKQQNNDLKNQINKNGERLVKQKEKQRKTKIVNENTDIEIKNDIKKLHNMVNQKVDKTSMDGEAQKIFRLVKAKLKDTKPQDVENSVVPIKKYLATLLYCEQPPTPIPCQPGRMHYGVSRFQNSLEANSGGHCAVIGSFDTLAQYANTSTTAPFLYANQAGYNPTSTSNNVTGGWNVNMINQNGINFSINDFSAAKITSAHVTIQVSGVSLLNRQGTLHIFEDEAPQFNVGAAVDTTVNNALLNAYDVNSFPKCTKYTRIELNSFDHNHSMRYTFLPPSLYSTPRLGGLASVVSAGVSATTLGQPFVSLFGVVLQNAATTTILNFTYEIYYVCDVENDSVSKFPIQYTNCFVNPDPYLLCLKADKDAIITTDKDEHKLFAKLGLLSTTFPLNQSPYDNLSNSLSNLTLKEKTPDGFLNKPEPKYETIIAKKSKGNKGRSGKNTYIFDEYGDPDEGFSYY